MVFEFRILVLECEIVVPTLLSINITNLLMHCFFQPFGARVVRGVFVPSSRNTKIAMEY